LELPNSDIIHIAVEDEWETGTDFYIEIFEDGLPDRDETFPMIRLRLWPSTGHPADSPSRWHVAAM
jgi:hypothetical protein